MIEVPVFDIQGNELERIQIDESVFGDRIHDAAVRQVVRMYEANRRVGTACAKTRSEVVGSTRKLFPQKHTGRARAGDRKAPHWRGGYAVFGPRPRDYSFSVPRRVRLLALRSAYLGKLLDKEIVVINELKLDMPKTREMAAMLGRLKVEESCLIAVESQDPVLWKSARNIPRVSLKPINEVNAYDLLLHRRLVITLPALQWAIDRFSGRTAEVSEGAGT